MLWLILTVTIILFPVAIIASLIFWSLLYLVPFLVSLILLGAVFGVHHLEEMLT